MIREPPVCLESTVLSLPPLQLRAGAGCCPRRGPGQFGAGLIKLIGRSDICEGEELAWLSAWGAEVWWQEGVGVALPGASGP